MRELRENEYCMISHIGNLKKKFEKTIKWNGSYQGLGGRGTKELPLKDTYL